MKKPILMFLSLVFLFSSCKEPLEWEWDEVSFDVAEVENHAFEYPIQKELTCRELADSKLIKAHFEDC